MRSDRIAIITVILTLAVFLTASVTFAQELTVSGEIKTGFYMEQEQTGKLDPRPRGGMTNNDGDSGGGEGRVRLDLQYTYGNMGFRLRFQIEPNGLGPFLPTWSYMYAYGYLLDRQLILSAGLLGESPWGTGGPELWSEPETRQYIGYNHLSREPYSVTEGLMGIRFEYKPSFLPGLNLGFVLNQPDQVAIAIQNQTFANVLGESVIGAAYENSYFAIRAGYRFDGEADTYKNNTNEGGRLSYRLEERVLGSMIDGMKVWLNGSYYGIGCEQQEIEKMIGGNRTMIKIGSGEYFTNWLYWLWDTDLYIARLHTCFTVYKSYSNDEWRPIERQEYQSLEIKPAFYCKFYDNLFQAGLGFGFGMEFGPGKTYIDSAYQYFSVEPQIRLNISSNAYIALLYNYTDKYMWPDDSEILRGDKSIKHWINLRAVYMF